MTKTRHHFNENRCLNRAHWREVEEPIYHLEANFSDRVQFRGQDVYNLTFEGAQTNLKKFGRLQDGEPDLTRGKLNGIIFDEKNWRIKIIGIANAKIFHNWIAKTDPMLNQMFAEKGFRYSLEAMNRNSEPVTEPVSLPERKPPQASHRAKVSPRKPPQRQELSGLLFGDTSPLPDPTGAFDIPGTSPDGKKPPSRAR